MTIITHELWEIWDKGIHEFFVVLLQLLCNCEIILKCKVHRNRGQRDGYQKGGDGRIGRMIKGIIVNDIVINLQVDRWLLKLSG